MHFIDFVTPYENNCMCEIKTWLNILESDLFSESCYKNHVEKETEGTKI